MTVDGFANLPLRSAPNVELPDGVLSQGTPYAAVFNQADNALYLQGFYGNLGIPLLGGMDFCGIDCAKQQFHFPDRSGYLSRTAFRAAFAHGERRLARATARRRSMSRTSAVAYPTGVDNMGGAAQSHTGFRILDRTGGAATETLATDNLPPYTRLRARTLRFNHW